MQNFTFYNPVKIYFGKGEIVQLKNAIPKNKKIPARPAMIKIFLLLIPSFPRRGWGWFGGQAKNKKPHPTINTPNAAQSGNGKYEPAPTPRTKNKQE